MKQNNFSAVYTTATFVTVLSIAERSLGFLYRIVLSRLIGGEGVGLYQIAFSVYMLLHTLGAGGIPVSVSKLIAKGKADHSQTTASALSSGLFLSLCITLPCCLIMFAFPKSFAFLFSNKRSQEIFFILLPALVFSCLYAIIRASFWGDKQFFLPAILEVLEECILVICGILFMQQVTTPLDGAKKASLAVAFSSFLIFIITVICYLVKKGKFCNPKKCLKPLLNASLPITFTRTSSTFVNSILSLLLPVILVHFGYTDSEAVTLLGTATGMVMPVLMIPATLIASLSVVLMPQLAEDYYSKNVKKLYTSIQKGLIFAFLLPCFLIPFFFALGEDLGRLAFSSALAGELILKGCPILLPMCVCILTSSILNTLGFEKQTLSFYFIGTAMMFLSIIFLTPHLGIYAYILGLGLSFFTTALCNLLFLNKRCEGVFKGQKSNVKRFFIGFSLILPLSIFGQVCLYLLKNVFGAFLSLCLAGFLLGIACVTVWTVFKILPFDFFKALLKKFKIKKRIKILNN